MDTLTQKQLAAWAEIPAKEQMAIRVALACPGPLGAVLPHPLGPEIRTSLGWAVSGRWVTPLGRELSETAEFESGAAPAKPKRSRAKAGAA